MIIPTILTKTSNGTVGYDLYSRLLEENIICIHGEIETEMAMIIVGSLKYLEAKNPKDKISIWINSPGGSILDGYSIIDTMKSIKNPIETIATGMVASMGTTIFINGDKGSRLIQEHSELLVHQPSSGCSGQVSDMEIVTEHSKRLKEQLEEEYSKLTGISKKKMHDMMDRDTILTAKEAVELGFADKII